MAKTIESNENLNVESTLVFKYAGADHMVHGSAQAIANLGVQMARLTILNNIILDLKQALELIK